MSDKNWSRAIIVTQVVIALILGLAILGYGYINAQSKKEELELKKNTFLIEAQAEKVKDEKYNSCIAEAERNNSSWWESTCKAKKLGENCLLPEYNADTTNNSLKEEKDRCVELYK